MAKKTSRRSRRRSTPNVPIYTPPTTPGAKVVESAAAQLYTGAVVRSKEVDFRSEYRYVITDLRNMLLLALVMVILLVTLNFVL
ncbi:MAG: hypothetical protein HUU23_06505 [Caldilineales bacterium]|nr:hypothetical protein [Caldilineales bacterium]